MAFNRVIVISTVKIFKSDLVKYDLSKYFPVSKFEIWDLSLIFNKKIPSINYNIAQKKINIFTKKEDFSNKLNQLSKEDLIIDPFKVSRLKFINKILKKNNVKIAFYNLGPLPIDINNRKNQKYILKKILASPKYFFNKLINYFLTKDIEANFFFIVNKNVLKLLNKKVYKNSKIILTHSFDFNRYLEFENKKRINFIKKDYIVFIDEGVTNHPDYEYLNLKPYCSESIYFRQINKFFDNIEEKFKMKVVIAAHPKVEYKSNKFNRKIYFNKTLQLIKNSNLVLAHMSTAINYAVIYKKPILFINSLNYKFNLNNQILINSNSLKSKVIYISENYILKSSIFNINILAYDKYIKNYISPNIKDKRSSWEIVSINMKSYN